MVRKVMILSWLLVFSFSAMADEFPSGPDPRVTPGSLCDRPNEHRYPEKIKYCTRNVDKLTKQQVFRVYIQELGFNIDMKERAKYKIDHLIPLCAGGSNQQDNLWPQHQKIYSQTDPMEPLACEKMAEGKLTQKKAIEMILAAKHDLRLVPSTIRALESL